MKKSVKLLLVLLVLGLILLGLTLASARYARERITSAIDAIGEVSYTEETRALLDAADAALAGADPNLHLEDRIPNLSALKDAKVEYVKLAVKDMYIAIRDKQPEETIREKLAAAEEAFGAYLTEEDAPLLKNYSDLQDARAKYGSAAADTPQSQPAQPEASVEVELCPA